MSKEENNMITFMEIEKQFYLNNKNNKIGN